MMIQPSSRKTFMVTKPYREERPSTSKIIFLSCEGASTEEDYFNMISELYSDVKSKIQFVSVSEEIVRIPNKFRTAEQRHELGKNTPLQLVEKIKKYKIENKYKYDFDKHPDDEFWIVADVDHHTNEQNIDDWNKALLQCEENDIGYAISNPNFELWLLLHHVDVNEEDYKYAVTEEHQYEPTNHFRNRLRNDAKAPLKKRKHLKDDKGKYPLDKYNKSKVEKAALRAKKLNINSEKWPSSLGSTVYLLIEEIQKLTNGG